MKAQIYQVLNKDLKLNNIFYKDESKRFHLKSFKALGGAADGFVDVSIDPIVYSLQVGYKF